mmetsp:Transcript_96697/g.152389  ORF Transcript_96697/g.152389 Transcript_96697/m.152389 type:complete len:1120 (+) Transcript_96697:138-3497(+)
MPLAAWDLRGVVEVLYTPQKAARRPRFREGSFRVGAGRATLLDSAGRELDAETVTEALVDQLRRGEEIDFPGHLIQPQQALELRPISSPCFIEPTSQLRFQPLPPSRTVSTRRSCAIKESDVAPASTTTNEQMPEKKPHQPFKRPRVAAEAPGAAVGAIRSSAAHVDGVAEMRAPDFATGGVRPTSEPYIVTHRDLWQECVNEDRQLKSTPASTAILIHGLWEACVLEDKIARESAQQAPLPLRTEDRNPQAADRDPVVLERTAPRPVATPCRESGLPVPEPHVNTANATLHACDPGVPEDALDSDEDDVFLRAMESESIRKDMSDDEDDIFLRAMESENIKKDASDDDRPLTELSKKSNVTEATPKKLVRGKKQPLGLQTSIRSKVQKHIPKRGGERFASKLIPLHFSVAPPMNSSMLLSHAVSQSHLYCQHFVKGLVHDVQARLSDIAASWQKAGGEIRLLPPEVNLVAKNLLIGIASGIASMQTCPKQSTMESASTTSAHCITLIFGRRTVVARGNTRSCARGDLWVLLPPGFEPVLVRALWRGVSPRGRLLCAAVNEAAVNWINTRRSRQGLVTMTGLSSGAFSAELEQIDSLHACCEGLSSNRAELAQDGLNEDGFLSMLVGSGTSTVHTTDSSLRIEPPQLSPNVTQTSALTSLSDEQTNIARWVAAWAESSSDPNAVLVRGVFGSGKSCTLAACIRVLDQVLTSQKDPRRILLVCQTNAAVDNVLKALLTQHSWDDFARLGSFKTVHPSLLHRTVSLLATRQAAEKELSEALSRLHPDVVGPLQQAIERGVLPPKSAVWRRRRLVAATVAALSSAEHLGDTAVRCPFVLVDEATQLTEPAIFLCLRRAMARRILLMGDPRQLPPRARYAPLAQSLLERLWDEGPAAVRATLSKQYRCHPSIAQLAGGLFYGGEVVNGVSDADRQSILGAAASPLVVLLSQGVETRAGQSYEHLAEARLCSSWVQRVVFEARGSLRATDFGVVCLYRPQAAACAGQLAGMGLRDVEASTVDAFQGSEREVILLSCGRSSPLRPCAQPRGSVGLDALAASSAGISGDAFAVCPRRLNVALTRARRHLIVVGAEVFLRSHPYLSKVLEVARSRGSVFTARDVCGS